jgi:hypothetical protein
MEPEIIQIVEMLVAIVAAIVAYGQHRQKITAEETAEEAFAGMNIAQTQLSMVEAEKADVVAFFDPGNERVTVPPADIPARSWKMNDETKRWVTIGHSPDDQASLEKQIALAEEQRKYHYFISVPGSFYEIEYGLLKGGGKG